MVGNGEERADRTEMADLSVDFDGFASNVGKINKI